MVRLIPTLLAVVAVVMFGFALWSMSAERYGVAGVSFLSASITIYLRETQLRKE